MTLRPVGSRFALALFALAAALAPFVPAAEDEAPPGLVVALKGHKEAVFGIAFSADGKYIVTGSGDPSVKVWEAATGKELKTFAGPNGHKGLVLSVALSPDGAHLATAGADNTARIWDFPGSKSLRDFALTTDPRTVAVSPDGTRLAAGGKDGKVRLWNATDGKQLQELSGHTGEVKGLTFSPNGQTLVSAGADSTLRYWNVSDGKALAIVGAHPGVVTGVSYNPGGNIVYSCGLDGTLRFWSQPGTAKALQSPFAEGVTALAVSSDGGQVVAGAGKVVRLSSLSTGQTTKEFAGAIDAVTSVAVTGALVAAGTADRKVMLWQTKDGQMVMAQPAHGGAVTGVAFNPGGNQLATVGKDGMLRLFAVPPAPSRSVSGPDAIRTAVLSADGKRLATGGADRTIRLYKLDNLKTPERQLTGHAGAVQAVAFSPDGKMLASGGEKGTLRFWNLDKGEQAVTLGAHTGGISSLTWAGDRVLSSSADGTLKVWHVPTAKGPAAFAHAGAVTCQALSPDGTRLLTGCDDKQVRSWNVATGQLERTWTGPTLGVLSVAFSPRGDRVAAGSADKAILVWEAAGNKVVQKVTGLPAAVHALALTADGKFAVAGLADGTLRQYDLATGKEVRSLDGHKGTLTALALTGKGDQIVTTGADGNVLVRSLAGGPVAQTWKHAGAVHAVALSRDGNRVAVGGAGKQVKVHTLADGKVEATITTPAEVRGLSFSADGKRLAVAGGDGRARLFALDGQAEEYFAHDAAVNAVTFAADGKRIFTAGADKIARTWTPSLLWQGRHEGGVRQLVVSPRGDRVISAGDDGLVSLWNYGDGKPAGSLRAHTGAVLGVSLSSDAARLATVGADKTARVWELAKAKTATKELDKPAVSITLTAAPLSVSLAPNGQRVAVGVEAAGKEQVLVYDTSTSKELLTLGEAGVMPARVLAFQSDNRTLLVAGGDKTARLIDVNVLAVFEVHPGGCAGVAFHDNGTQVLTAGTDRTAKLWTLATGKLERTFGPLAASVDAVALSRGGSTQVAATAGKSLKVWNTADGKETLAIGMPSSARGVSFSSDRTRIATAGEDGRVRVWDVALKLEQQGFLHSAAATAVAFHPSQPAQLVSASLDRSVGIHALSSARTLVVGAAVNGLAVAPNSTHVLTAGADGKVKLINVNSGAADRTCDAGAKSVTSVAVARSGVLIAAGGADRKLRLFNFADAKLVSQFNAPAEPRALGFSGNSQAIVAAGADGSVTTWDVVYTAGQPLPADFGKVMQTYQHAAEAADVAFATAGAVFYTAGADRTVRAWKIPSDSPTRTFNLPNTANVIAYDKTGKLVAVGGGDGQLRLFDPEKNAVVRQINAHPSMTNDAAVYGVAFSPDGTQVVTASRDHSLKLFNVADGKLIRDFKAYDEKKFPKGHQDAALCVAFSPDGKQLASGGADRAIKIWNVADGNVVREFAAPALKPAGEGQPAPAHPGWVYALRWADGGKTLVSAGGAPRLKGYVATWDVATGKQHWAKELAVGTIYALAVSPDGKHYAIGTGGSVRADRDLNQGLVVKMPK